MKGEILHSQGHMELPPDSAKQVGFPILLLGKKSHRGIYWAPASLSSPLRSGIKHFYRAKPHLGDKKKRALGVSGWKNKIEICRMTFGIGKEGTVQQDLLCLAFGLGESSDSSKLLLSTETLKPGIFAEQHHTAQGGQQTHTSLTFRLEAVRTFPWLPSIPESSMRINSIIQNSKHFTTEGLYQARTVGYHTGH